MKLLNNIKWRKLLRSLHRDLGYFFVGLTCVYGISGTILNLRQEGKDPAFKEIQVQRQLETGLSNNQLKKSWNSNPHNSITCTHVAQEKDNYKMYVKGGMGTYNPHNGVVKLIIYKKRPFIKFINDIHYNQVKRFTWLTNFFAISLVFFALSGLVIIKGKNGFKKRGIWLMAVGIAIPVILYFI